MRKSISINRKPNATNLPDEVYHNSKRGLGATWTASGDVNTGLSMDEIQKYMPSIISIPVNDTTFLIKVKRWFTDLSINVPAAGVDFEIGIDPKSDFPYEVIDYVKYRFAATHPYLLLDAKDPKEVQKKRKFMFILEDKSKVKAANVVDKNNRKKSLKEWIKLTADEAKMDQVLRVLGLFPEGMDTDDKEIALEKAAKETPKVFIEATTSSSLALQSLLREFLSMEVLRKVGNTYLNGEESLGDSEEEAVLFLDNKANSDVLVTLKAKLKQFNKGKS